MIIGIRYTTLLIIYAAPITPKYGWLYPKDNRNNCKLPVLALLSGDLLGEFDCRNGRCYPL